MSAGTYHTLAVTADGAVLYWGDNSFGELQGQGGSWYPQALSSPVPVAVSGLSTGVLAVSTAEIHTCVVMSAGGVKCWGDNMFGELGDGTLVGAARRRPTSRASPALPSRCRPGRTTPAS